MNTEAPRPGLKEVEYYGFHGSKGKVAYEIRGKKIIFTALCSSREATSTVQAAEKVVTAICEAEGIDWKDPEFNNKYEFYDLSTPIGYPGRTEGQLKAIREIAEMGDVQIDKLEIIRDKNYIFVHNWIPINLQEAQKTLLNPSLEPNPNG